MDEKLQMKIRQGIFDYGKPFCTTNLYIYFKRLGITNKEAILDVLDTMFDEGVVIYTETPEPYNQIENAPRYVFMVK